MASALESSGSARKPYGYEREGARKKKNKFNEALTDAYANRDDFLVR